MPTEPLINSLHAVRRRAKLVSVAQGAGVVLSLAMGLLLATVLADYLLNLRPVPRLLVMLLAGGGLAYSIFRWVLQPGIQRISLSDIAGRLERAFPQFDDRLRSTLNFVHEDPRHDETGSAMMKRRVVVEALEISRTVNLGSAVITTPAWYSLGGAAVSVLAIVLIASLVGAQLRSIALEHLFNPFAAHPWPHRVRIVADGSLPTRVPVGQRLDVRMSLARGDKPSIKPVVCYQYDNGPIDQELMNRDEAGVFTAAIDAHINSSQSIGNLRVWLKAGDDQLDFPAITVVPRLTIKSVTAIITPPAYVTNLPPTTVNLAAAPAVMAVGSHVALHVALSKPLAAGSAIAIEPIADASATTQPASPPRPDWSVDSASNSGGEMSMVGQFTAANPIRFHLRAVDVDGFSNNALEEYELIVRADQPPTVQIENPRRNEERTADAVVPLQGLAEDDYGIQSLKLVVDRINRASDSTSPPASGAPTTSPADNTNHWEIPLVDRAAADATAVNWTRIEGTGEGLRFRANYNWELSQLSAGLRPGDVLEYYLLVTDNFNLNGQTHAAVPSGKLRINIISQDEFTNRIIADLQSAKTQVDNVKRVQSRTQEETGTLADDTKDKPKLDEADRIAAQRLTGQQSAAAGETRQIAARVQEIGQRLEENKSPQQDLKDLARDVASDLNDAAENPMKQAAQALGDAQQSNISPQARNADMEQAKQSQSQASDDLQRAMDRMGDIGSLQQTIAKLNQLLRDQQAVEQQTQQAGRDNLGKSPDEMSDADRQKLQAAADAQAKLADRTASALDAMNKAAQQLSKADPAAAEAMSKAAQTAAQQQVTPSQQQAAEQTRQNQQSSAQAAQKQAELGLQMIVADLQQAEKRKLAQLSKQLEELQAQIANLIRRQAGHNFDNLTVQGTAALGKLDAATLADLVHLADRTPAQASQAPDPDNLAPSQEQTEHNTRDIAKSADAVANGAQAAAQLVRAAGHMERALVSLTDSDWPAAYNPPQVEALTSLKSAQKLVDEQKAKVDNQIAAGQKESIRQKYVQIKQDQDKLNQETARINTARAGGELRRADLIRFGQLPGEQGKLADQVAALDPDLQALDSTVYVWANKDIAESMNQVKDDLPAPEKSAATLVQQQGISDQLDSMIRNLATHPKESKFAAEGNGGGGGKSGSPPMPPEAELRLLKDLQRGINTGTKVAAAQPQPDKEKLLALGNRQGELRDLLDQVLQKSSKGELKLNPEPDPSTQLPEEAHPEEIENQELQQNLLNGKPNAEPEENQAGLIGDRMARSRQRLAIAGDAGRITQMIQDRILKHFDVLIDQARQQMGEVRNPPKNSQSPQQLKQPGDQMAKAENQGKQPGTPGAPSVSNPAQVSSANAPGNANTDLSKQIKESLAEWGQVTPRLRDAQIEGSSETIIEQYRKLTEDYYRSLATKASDHQ